MARHFERARSMRPEGYRVSARQVRFGSLTDLVPCLVWVHHALRSGHRPKPWQRKVLGRLGNGLLARGIGAADFVEVVVPIECTACTRARPLCRYARIILRARRAAIVHVLSLTFLSNVVAYGCRAPPG